MRLYNNDFVECDAMEVLTTLKDLGLEYTIDLDHAGNGLLTIQGLERPYIIVFNNWVCKESCYL